MFITDHLTHRLTPLEYAWDTVSWATHVYLPEWLASANRDKAAARLRRSPQVWDARSYQELTPALVSMVPPLGNDHFWVIERSLELIRSSGWWRVLQGCLIDPKDGLVPANCWVPFEVVDTEGPMFLIVSALARDAARAGRDAPKKLQRRLS